MNQENTAYKLQNEDLYKGILDNFDVSTLNSVLYSDPTRVTHLINFYKGEMANADKAYTAVCETQIAILHGILLRITAINADVFQITSETMASDIDAVGTVNQPSSEEKDPDAKVMGLVVGEKLLETPDFAQLAKACKKLLSKGNRNAAFELATKYLGEGKYKPKDTTKEPFKWAEKGINSWLDDITEKSFEETSNKTKAIPLPEGKKKEIIENAKKEADKTKVSDEEIKRESDAKRKLVEDKLKGLDLNVYEEVTDLLTYNEHRLKYHTLQMHDIRKKPMELTEEDKKDFDLFLSINTHTNIRKSSSTSAMKDAIVGYGTPCKTLSDEYKALDDLAEVINNLNIVTDETTDEEKQENKRKASGLVNMFFQYRGYSKTQTDNWVNAVSKNLNNLDHDSLLGVPELIAGGIVELINYEQTYEELCDELRGEIIKDVSVDDLISEYTNKLFATTFVNKEQVSYNLYTPAQVEDFIRRTYAKIKSEIKPITEQSLSEHLVNCIKEHRSIKDIKETALVKGLLDNPFEADEKSPYNFPKEQIDENIYRFVENMYNVLKREMQMDDMKSIVTKGDLIKYLRKNEKTELDDIMTSKLVKRIAEKGGLASDAKKVEDRWIVERFKGAKELRDYIEALRIAEFAQTHPVRETTGEPVATVSEVADSVSTTDAVAKKENGHTKKDFKGHKVEDIIPERPEEVYYAGRALIEEHNYTKEDIDKWGKEHILNKDLKGSNPGSTFTDEKILSSFLENMFKTTFERVEKGETSPESLTEPVVDEEVKNIIINGEGLASSIKKVRDYFKSRNLTIGLKQLRDFLQPHVATLNDKLLKRHTQDVEKQKVETKEESNEEVHTVETFQKIDIEKEYPELYQQIEKITSIEELEDLIIKNTNFDDPYKASNDWELALSIAITAIIELMLIKTAINWDEPAVIEWFNKRFAEGTNEQSEEPIVDAETDFKTDDEEGLESDTFDFSPVTEAVNANSYKDGIREVLKKYGDKKEVKDQLVEAIQKKATGKYAARVSKNRTEDTMNTINNQAKLIEQHN